MTEQRVSNERKKELEQLDPFQEKLIKSMVFVKTFKKQLSLIAGGIVLIIAVFSGIMYSFEKSEKAASILVSQAMAEYVGQKDPLKGYEQVKADFELVFKDYANTAAGRLARVTFAKICYDASKYDDSYDNYKTALDLFENQAMMENFILVSLGHVSLAKNDNEAAQKYFNRVRESATDLLKDEALFSLGLIAEASGNAAQSKEAFEKLAAEYETSIYHPLAKSKIN